MVAENVSIQEVVRTPLSNVRTWCSMRNFGLGGGGVNKIHDSLRTGKTLHRYHMQRFNSSSYCINKRTDVQIRIYEGNYAYIYRLS